MKVVALLTLLILVIPFEKVESFRYPPIYPVTYNRRQNRILKLPNESEVKKPMLVPNRLKSMDIIKNIISKLDSALGKL